MADAKPADPRPAERADAAQKRKASQKRSAAPSQPVPPADGKRVA